MGAGGVWGLLDGPASTMISPCFCRDEEWARERDGKIYIRKELVQKQGTTSSNFHEEFDISQPSTALLNENTIFESLFRADGMLLYQQPIIF